MSTLAERPNRNYESVVILKADVSDEEQKKFFKRNLETIKGFKGELNHIDTWGKRRLANPIEKNSLGNYFHLTFSAQPQCVSELERVMKIDDRVLRYSHVKLDSRQSLAKHVEKYKDIITESNKREQEREAKRDARRKEASARPPRRREERHGAEE